MGSRSHCLFGESWRILEISSIFAGEKDKKTEIASGSEWDGVGAGFEEILRWRLDTLSEKKEVEDLASNYLGIADGSVIVQLLWSKELILVQN